ncbi:MAG: hypothetical protein RL078_1213 [Bacteroidota bacterium]|jgi:predicted phosphodiesterase
MLTSFKRYSKNVHLFEFNTKKVKIAAMSDVHWDNPKCDWDLLKRHLDYCLKHNIYIIFPGDVLCLMQGRGDRRGSKDDIRPEHNNARYLDSIVETAVDFFAPYAKIMLLVGYGNHETSVIKYQETDVLRRFVDLFNYKTGSQLQIGGYGGWVIIKLGTNSSIFVKIKYFHGSGGGGVVTRGEINLTRALQFYENFDILITGHIHENKATEVVRDTLASIAGSYQQILRPIHLMICGTYKEEYGDGSGGWHIERGAPPKPIGGRIITLENVRSQKGKKSTITKHIDSMKFPGNL